MVKAIDYDSFGNIITDTDPAFEIPFGFAGGLYDQDTKLVRFGVRDYDPDIGRWTAKDPIFFTGGDTDLYGYCLNDPVNAVDPEGQFAGVAVGIISGAYVGFLSGIQSGNVWTGIASGALGGLAGGIDGFIAPQLGCVIGKIAGGVVGGAVGGGLGKVWSKPCASGWEIAGAVVKGAGIGALTGYMEGGMIASTTAAGVPKVAASVGAAMFTAPIHWGLGMGAF